MILSHVKPALRSERTGALLLLGAALAGIILANSPLGPDLLDLQHTEVGVGSLTLSIGHWISDGLLAIFFLVVAIDLRHELTAGQLNSWQRALHPAIAAVGGVVVPALVYLLIAAPAGQPGGWPIPTATDIAFALGVLAMFGRGLPPRIRVFLLALAVLDDLIAILIIAIFFGGSPDLLALAGAVIVLVVAAIVARALGRATSREARIMLGILLVILGIATWVLTQLSGVHATLAGVAFGLILPAGVGHKLGHRLEPWSAGLVLPIFAFSATLVVIPHVPLGELSAPFWGILAALPIGKLIGITLGGLLGAWLLSRNGSTPTAERMRTHEIVAVGLLGGIGFTVSLLMTTLAFENDLALSDQGILAVLLGSVVSAIAAAIALTVMRRRTSVAA
ncbi:Na+/H+ antiporter NhaA [Mycetocola lacteus]|uniref:Na(+)/H(+) antiporter NhaA n=1 Tax=Mycetocola lacteus TaxID=76637 RepID=A0A3L7ALQ9_9MICO|nr:Na+/H+ antiporter NhaA [Mycetocola lacteus]RLP80895.1 Na+/H+ antiporter NhaA [Mycetocola lacteus]RLP84680.1 Na+/H+ antiporter NhaA [Mycetocola lacteus]